MSGRQGSGLSFASLALGVAGSAVAVLAVTALLVAVLDVSPAVKAVIVLVGLVAAVGGMAVVSRRFTNAAIDREFGGDDHPAEETTIEGGPGPSAGGAQSDKLG